MPDIASTWRDTASRAKEKMGADAFREAGTGGVFKSPHRKKRRKKERKRKKGIREEKNGRK